MTGWLGDWGKNESVSASVSSQDVDTRVHKHARIVCVTHVNTHTHAKTQVHKSRVQRLEMILGTVYSIFFCVILHHFLFSISWKDIKKHQCLSLGVCFLAETWSAVNIHSSIYFILKMCHYKIQDRQAITAFSVLPLEFPSLWWNRFWNCVKVKCRGKIYRQNRWRSESAFMNWVAL